MESHRAEHPTMGWVRGRPNPVSQGCGPQDRVPTVSVPASSRDHVAVAGNLDRRLGSHPPDADHSRPNGSRANNA